jgi:hypothetical protein
VGEPYYKYYVFKKAIKKDASYEASLYYKNCGAGAVYRNIRTNKS